MVHDQAEFGITLELGRHPDLPEEEPLLHEPLLFFCRAEHPLSGPKTVTWKDLRQTELIMVGGSSRNRALLDYQLAKNRVSLRGEVEHLSTARHRPGHR